MTPGLTIAQCHCGAEAIVAIDGRVYCAYHVGVIMWVYPGVDKPTWSDGHPTDDDLVTVCDGQKAIVALTGRR